MSPFQGFYRCTGVIVGYNSINPSGFSNDNGVCSMLTSLCRRQVSAAVKSPPPSGLLILNS
jgi:hypothetical protein